MVLFVNRTILFYHLKKIMQQYSQFRKWFFAQDSLVFEKQTHTHTHIRKRKYGSNTKVHHNSTQRLCTRNFNIILLSSQNVGLVYKNPTF